MLDWDRRRWLTTGAWATSAVASLASLSLSGLPALGWWGMGLPPCELCWYQRILMYPLVLVLGLAVWRWETTVRVLAATMASLGALVATYHSLIQRMPSLELGQCGVGSCTAQLWTLGGLTIPNLSLIAFLMILGWLAATHRLAPAPHEQAEAAPG